MAERKGVKQARRDTKRSPITMVTSLSLTPGAKRLSDRGAWGQRPSGSTTLRYGSCSTAAGTKEEPRSVSKPRFARHTASTSSLAVGDPSSALTVHCSTSTGRARTISRSSGGGNRSSAPTKRSSAGTSTGACLSSARRPPDRICPRNPERPRRTHVPRGLSLIQGFVNLVLTFCAP